MPTSPIVPEGCISAMTAGGYLKRLTRRLTEDIDQLDAEDISQQSQQQVHSVPAIVRQATR